MLCSFRNILVSRRLNTHFGVNLVRQSHQASYPCPQVSFPPPQFDYDFLVNPENIEKMRKNISLRKSDADLDEVLRLHTQFSASGDEEVGQKLLEATRKLPNMCAEKVLQMGDNNRTLYESPVEPPTFKLRKFEEIARILSGGRLTNLGNLTGERTYYLTGPLAELEQALVQWTVARLVAAGFSLLSVPDLLHPEVIAACGMTVGGERTQVYELEPHYGQVALSGTSEMAVGGFLAGKTIPGERRYCAVSRCFRAETGRQGEERGLYRVHQFTKVEMFCVTPPHLSQAALEDVLSLERTLFSELGLAFRVLEMCGEELGSPASQKFDIEAWLPGRASWGEISSCSNCTDYQARRLNIRDPAGLHCHTVNGTGCAVPRMLIAICEQKQTENGSVIIPETLRPFMRNREMMEPKPKKQRLHFQYLTSAKYFEKNKI